MMKEYRFDTKMIHAGQAVDKGSHARMVPIYQTTAYTFDSTEHAKKLFSLEEGGNIYSRLMNPTNDTLEQRVAALDSGIGAVAFASGHAAIFHAVLNLCKAGDEVVVSRAIYGGAINLFGVTLRDLGIHPTFVDPDDMDAWQGAITDKTKLFFTEVIGNPNANVSDLESIAAIAHAQGIPFLVDSTFTTPYLCRPIDFGADFVVHSATKFLGGHGTAMAGIVVDSGRFPFAGNPRFPQYNQPDESYHGLVYAKDCGNAAFITRLRTMVLRDVGGCLAPMNAYLILMGIETLSLRMKRHCENALAVAQFLEGCEQVDRVHYPALVSSEYYERAKKYLPNGAGSVFTVRLKGGKAAAAAFIDALQLFSIVANVGDTRSLVIQPAMTTHAQLSEEQLKLAHITGGTVRLSIGLEDIEDILGDLRQALEKISQ